MRRRIAAAAAAVLAPLAALAPVTAAPPVLAAEAAEPAEAVEAAEAAEAELPSLPLPDCNEVGNDVIGFDPEVDCEGTIGVVQKPSSDPGYEVIPLSGIDFSASTRTLDFRLSADRGGDQLVTLTMASSPPPSFTDTNGDTYTSEVVTGWPQVFSGSTVEARTADEPFHEHHELALSRVGECAWGDTSCTYRVDWGRYTGVGQERIERPVIWRVATSWSVLVSRDRHDGSTVFPYQIGQGRAFTTFRTDPPPPLEVRTAVRRLGPRYFELSGEGSGPDLVAHTWSHTSVPAFPASFSSPHLVTLKDFGADHPELPAGSSTTVQLYLQDRWGRVALADEPIVLLPSGGAQVLAITTLEVVSVGGGLARLRAVVQNGSPTAVSGIGLVGERDPSGTVSTTPASIASLAPGASGEFTVTVPLDELGDVGVQVQAHGTGQSGPVQSAPRSTVVETEPQTPGSTTLTSASPAGADRIEVASNDGFGAGDYAEVGSGSDAETRRISGLGSLIFSAPLARAHPAGSPVVEVDPPGGDTTRPVIAVSTPTAGQVVVQGEPLTLDHTCSDAGVGVESCGGTGPADGASLPTDVPGPRTVTVEAWDRNGNTSSTTVAYTVASRANRSFVAAAVRDLLDREATTGELDLLGVALDSGARTRAQVLTGLTTSTEWVSSIVRRFYRDVLGREGEPDGVAYWTDVIRSGRRSVASVAASFYGGREYVAGPGGGTAEGWVTALYRDLLGREPDPAGLAHWSALRLPRHAIALRFFQSRECRAARVEALYQALLGRAADPDGLAFWTARIGTMGDLALARAIAAGDEYYQRAQPM